MQSVDVIRCICLLLSCGLVSSRSCNDGFFWDASKGCVRCPGNCQFCESNEYCLSCKNGYWGNACEQSCSACKADTSCDKTNGFCLESCKDGYTGVLCDTNCSEMCSSCNRTNAQICLGCAHGWYPPVLCNQSCPDECFSRSCNAKGFCTDGCKNGFYGQRCELSCIGHCKDNLCHREKGTCVFGCANKYTGTECITAEETTGNTATVVAVVLSALTLVFIAVIASLIVVRRKRRMRLRKTKCTSRSSTQEENKEMLSNVEETNESANTGSAKKEKTEESSQTQAASRNTVLKRLCFCFKEQEAEKTKSLSNIGTKSPEVSDTQPSVPERKSKEDKLTDLVARLKAKKDEDKKKEFDNLPIVVQKSHTKSKEKDLKKEKVFPYDENVVTVHGKKEGELCVNASYIKDKGGKNTAYIASRAPPKKGDGLRGMWKIMSENNCRTVVMLNTYTKTRTKPKKKYWPKLNEKTVYGSLSVKYAREDKENMHTKQYIIREFELSEEGKDPKSVKHLQYTGWPEKTVPESKESLLDFIDLVKKENKGGEMLVVHGRLGVGRTGTFIALDMLLKEVDDLLESDDKKEIDIDIECCVRKLREQRVQMVENIEQYTFLYETLLFYAEKRLQEEKTKKGGSMKIKKGRHE